MVAKIVKGQSFKGVINYVLDKAKQVEKYEELVKEQAERMERDSENNRKIGEIQQKVNKLK